MAEQFYRIIFSGKIAPGQNIDEVKHKFAALYKKDVTTIERLIFTGKSVVIKSNLDQQTALQLQSTLTTRTGGLFEVEAFPPQQTQRTPESQPPQTVSAAHPPPQRKRPSIPLEFWATRPRAEVKPSAPQPPPQRKQPSRLRQLRAEAKVIKIPKHPKPSEGITVSIEDRVGFWPRLGALLLDLVLMLIISSLVGTFLGGLLGGLLSRLGGGIENIGNIRVLGAFLGGFLGIFVSLILVGNIYNLIEGFTGASPAKMILGFKIANADATKVSIGKLLLRYVLKNIMYITSIIAGIVGIKLIATIGVWLGVVWFFGCFAAIGKQKQALHDMILKTAVYPRNVF